MWENERKKKIIWNIAILLILILVTVGLLFSMLRIRKQIAAEDALLSEQHNSQRQELNEVREGNLEAVQQAYKTDLETIARYMPGIVCWGDSLTAGSSGNISYPLTLQKYINAYLCDIYDLRYSVENPESYARLDWDSYKVSIPVINMGAGQEDNVTILGRSGVQPYVVKNDFIIPAGKDSVDISIMSENGKNVMPLTAGNVGVNPVTIAGVKGTLTRVSNNTAMNQYSYQFTRLEDGLETPVTAGTEVATAGKEEYQNYIHIVWLGTYDSSTNPNILVKDTKALLQHQIANNERYLVIGPCAYGGSWTPQDRNVLEAFDSAMLQEFGNRYINLRKYLVEDGLRDAGITPSKTDTTFISYGSVPDSFRSNAGGADLNGAAYKLLGKLVYERMELLGYFEEIRDELNLDKITQEILKDKPTYFQTILK